MNTIKFLNINIGKSIPIAYLIFIFCISWQSYKCVGIVAKACTPSPTESLIKSYSLYAVTGISSLYLMERSLDVTLDIIWISSTHGPIHLWGFKLISILGTYLPAIHHATWFFHFPVLFFHPSINETYLKSLIGNREWALKPLRLEVILSLVITVN